MIYRYSDANTYTDCDTRAEAERFQQLQNGGDVIVIKSMQDWRESGLDLGKFLKIGDRVTEDVATYFIEVLPPATWREALIQIGEPNDHVRGRATFATIVKRRGLWTWAGFCYRGEWVQP
jgi:hypothetical protein